MQHSSSKYFPQFENQIKVEALNENIGEEEVLWALIFNERSKTCCYLKKIPGNGARNASDVSYANAQKSFQWRQKQVCRRHQESFSCGYALRDFLGKYANDFPRGLGALRWCSLEAERVM